MWLDDKHSMLDTMIRNMTADLNAGYDYFGRSITNQRADIELYKIQMESEIDSFKSMSDRDVNRWCYFDLIKRGAIER
jgi:hypothetical protein